MSRKKKVNPEDYDQLVATIKQDALDNRTSLAKAMKDTRQALAENPGESIKAIIRNNIATLAMLQTEILRESQGKPFLNNGRLEKRLADDLLSVQKTLIQNCNLLSLIEGINKSRWQQKGKIRGAGNMDVAGYILDVQEKDK